METAQYDGHSSLPVVCGDLVGPFRRKSARGDGDQICRFRKGHLLEPFVNGPDLVFFGREGGEDGQRQGFHARRALVAFCKAGADQGDIHCATSSSGPR